MQCFISCNWSNKGYVKENLYEELDLESLQHRRWFRKLCTFYKIFKINLHVIFVSYYLSKPPLTTQDGLEIWPFFILNTIFSKILYSFCNIWMEQSRQIYSKFRKSEYFWNTYPEIYKISS